MAVTSTYIYMDGVLRRNGKEDGKVTLIAGIIYLTCAEGGQIMLPNCLQTGTRTGTVT